jgi:hypothetical protein
LRRDVRGDESAGELRYTFGPIFPADQLDAHGEYVAWRHVAARAVALHGVDGPAGPHERIPLTVPEVSRLLVRLIWRRPPDTATVLDWAPTGDDDTGPSQTLPVLSARRAATARPWY